MKTILGFSIILLMLSGCGRVDQSGLYTNSSENSQSEIANQREKPKDTALEAYEASEVLDLGETGTLDPVDKENEQPVATPTPNPAPTPTVPPKKTEPVVEKPATPKPFVGIGSVYYIPILDTKRSCKAEDVISMRDREGKELVKLCRSEIANCRMQGSCLYVKEKTPVLLAYNGAVAVQIKETKKLVYEPRFKVNDYLMKCPQGMGFRNICLDPNRSVAADMAFHQAGDVIYVPKVAGQKMPNGEIHDGYFIVRDIGGAIKGEGRFDFFIGFDRYETHIFTKLNLSDKNISRFAYYKMDPKTSDAVRVARKYPSAPEAVSEQALARLFDPVLSLETASHLEMAVAFYKTKWK